MPKPVTTHTRETLLARTVEDGGCLLWQGYIANRTPQVMFEGRIQPVRRVLLKLAGKPPRPQDYVTPECGDWRCICEDHFRVITRQTHLKAMAKAANAPAVKAMRISKGAATRQKTGKLTPEKVEEIRASADPAWKLAEKMGVDKSYINRVRAGKAWALVGNPWAGLMR